MPYSPVRNVEYMDVGSLGKEALHNDFVLNASLGISGAATIPLAATDHTLTTTNDGEAMRFVLILVGTLTANVNLIVPAESRVYVVDNRTTGAFTVTCRPAAGGGVAVDQSARTLIYCDGSNVYPVASGTGGGGGSGAPTDASYLVGASHTLLSGERVVTDTPTVTWDLGTAGQARAIIPPDAVSYTHIQNVSPTRLLGRFTAGSGDVQEITPGTGLSLDTGTGVLSATAVGQPLDATLTALAGLATGANQLPYSTGTDTFSQTPLTAFARTVLDDADAATIRGTISAQASDATLTALAGVTTAADTLPFFTGVDTASTTTLTAFMRGLLDDPDLATAQATLGITGGGGYTDEQAQDAVAAMIVDSAHLNWTYNDTLNDLAATIYGSSIGTAELTNDGVTYAKIQNVTDNRLLGRSAGSAGDVQEITIGTGLALTSGTLAATGGGGGAPGDADYITSTTNATLTAERVLTDTATITWDRTTAGQIKANATLEGIQDIIGIMVASTATIQLVYTDAADQLTANVIAGSIGTTQLTNDGVTYAKLQNVTDARLLGRSAGSAGDAQELTVGTGLTLSSGVLSASGGGGTWLALTDTPDTYAGQAGKVVQVNAGATATEFGPTLGTMAQQDAASVAITGGSVNGVSVVGTTGYFSSLGVLVTASYPLDVNGNVRLTGGTLGVNESPVAGAYVALTHDKTARYGMRLKAAGSDTGGFQPILFTNVADTSIGSISTNATTTAYNTSSDARLKDAIEHLQGALETVLALRPVQFLWKADGSVGHGLVAQEVAQVVAGVVSGTEDGPTPLGMDYSKLVPWLIGAVQVLAARVAALEGG